ncbi:MAG TPA: hypothetical protein DCY07_04565 [Rhodospirillaceae bacterium]|nr:hypothetical protein [Rhodospirillaceae bacterium]
MMLSKNTASVLVDMIENKLAMIQISDRGELREVMTLQRCLAELQGVMATSPTPNPSAEAVPTRGRHRKLSAMMSDFDIHHEVRQQA